MTVVYLADFDKRAQDKHWGPEHDMLTFQLVVSYGAALLDIPLEQIEPGPKARLPTNEQIDTMIKNLNALRTGGPDAA